MLVAEPVTPAVTPFKVNCCIPQWSAHQQFHFFPSSLVVAMFYAMKCLILFSVAWVGSVCASSTDLVIRGRSTNVTVIEGDRGRCGCTGWSDSCHTTWEGVSHSNRFLGDASQRLQNPSPAGWGRRIQFWWRCTDLGGSSAHSPPEMRKAELRRRQWNRRQDAKLQALGSEFEALLRNLKSRHSRLCRHIYGKCASRKGCSTSQRSRTQTAVSVMAIELDLV